MGRNFSSLHLYALGFLVFLYGPVLLMPLFSFNDGIFAVFPLKGFTLRHYAAMAANTSMLAALKDSLVVATVATAAGAAVAARTTAAVTVHR